MVFVSGYSGYPTIIYFPAEPHSNVSDAVESPNSNACGSPELSIVIEICTKPSGEASSLEQIICCVHRGPEFLVIFTIPFTIPSLYAAPSIRLPQLGQA